MVEKIAGFFNREIKGLHEAAYLLASFTFFSQLLAIVRDRLLASTFGASETVDVYYAAFRIPDLLFVIVTSFISASVLVPYLAKYAGDNSSMKKMVDSLFTIFISTVLVVSLVIFIFAPQLLQIFMPTIMAGEFASELLLFTRILLLSPIILGISQLFGSIVQAYRKFFVYAISPILYNFGIIIGIVFFYPIFGTVGLIYGVVIGLVMHVCIQIPTVVRHGLLPKFTFNIDWSTVREIIFISLPRSIALASTQILLLFLVALAGTLAAGSISVFNFSYNLQSVPLAIIGISYSMAAFPTLSKLFSIGNKEEFLGHLITAARHIIFWSFPVIVMFIVLRAQIVRTILGSGEFDWVDTKLTAAALAVFAVSVLAQSLILLFVRGYYSSGQTRKPLLINVFSMILTLILTIVFVSLFNDSVAFRGFFESLLRVYKLPGTVVLMLPLAFSIGTIVNAGLLWIEFERDFRGFSATLGRTFIQSLFASLVGGCVSYAFLQILSGILNLQTVIGIFMQGFLAGIIGLICGTFILILLNNSETKEIINALKNHVWKTRGVVVDQEELSG